MAETINSLLTKVRNKLKDYPTDVDYIASAVASGSTKLRFGDAEKINIGDIIEIGEEAIFIRETPYLGGYMDEMSELAVGATAFSMAANSADFNANDIIKMDAEYMKVAKVSAIGDDNIVVTRGQRGVDAAAHNQTAPVFLVDVVRGGRGELGTSASAHAVSASVNIIDRWADYEVREAVKTAIRGLYPDIYRDYVGKVNFKNENNFKILDDCDVVTDWAEADDADAVAVNTNDQAEGTACLDLGATHSTGAGNYSKTASATFDATNCNYLNIYFSLKNHIDTNKNYYFSQNALTIRWGNSDAIYYEWTVQRQDIADGDKLNRIVLAIADAKETGSVDITAMDYMYIGLGVLQDITSGDIKMDAWIATNFPYTSRGRKKFRLPKGVFGVNDVRLLVDEFGQTYEDTAYWHVEGDYEEMYLVFDVEPPSDRPIEIYGRQLYLVPSTNTTSISGEVDHIKELIVLDASIKLIDDLVAQKARYDKYISKIERSGSGVLDVYRSRAALVEAYDKLYQSFARPIGATDLDWTDLHSNHNDSSIINN